MAENYFSELYKVNVNDKVEKKNGLSYVSWCWAWAEVKKRHPDATFTIYERDGQYGPVNYFTDGRTCWVKTGLTINGIEHIEELPVMDFKNRSIPLEAVTSMDVNKAIQRSLTKAAARHGLGLYIYAGEDLPEGEDEPQKPAGYDKAAALSMAMTKLRLNPGRKEDLESFGRMLKDAQAAGKVAPKLLKDMSEEEHRAAMEAIVNGAEANG